MAIQILSDLHLESPKSYDTFEVTPTAPYLALLGDIGLAARHKDDLLGFLTVQLRQFRAVLFVPGNHEAYHSSWPEVLSILRDFERDSAAKNELGTFVLLDRAVFRPPDDHTTVVLGCSLFSAVPPESAEAVGNGLNDFYHTRADWDVAAHTLLTRVTWLGSMSRWLSWRRTIYLADRSSPMQLIVYYL